MRKFILYFLLLLLLAGIGTFAFGFWNAKNTRAFSQEAQAIRVKYNFESQIQEIEKGFRGGSGKKPAEMRQDAQNFVAQLDEISKQSETAKKEIEDLKTPGEARKTKQMLLDYYSKTGSQAENLRSLMVFMGANYGIAEIFSKIGENTTLDEMKSLISQAKAGVGAIKTESLPKELQVSAGGLKQSTEGFLVKLEEVATLASQETDQLSGAYATFSQKQDEFSAEGKKYIDNMEDLTAMEKQIDSELLRLNGIYFKIR
jgi:hypothetical protein